MQNNNSQEYQAFLKAISQLLSFSMLYDPRHRIFREKLSEVTGELKNLTSGSMSLVMSSVEGVLFINGQKTELKNVLIKRFMEALGNLQLGSVDIEPNFTGEEITVLISILNQKLKLKGADQIKKYFSEKNITHIIPRLAAYKLVKEDEKVVKGKGAINISDLPKEVVEKFSQSLNKGEASKFIKEGGAAGKTLAHDPAFLSGFVSDAAEKKNSVEELEKILWLVGDYLISEISTAKEEEINRKLLEEFKKRILSLWEKKKDKNWEETLHKTVTAISAALELKGLMVLCEKHKHELKKVLTKIRSILETLPQDSQLYKKTKEGLAKLGESV